MCTLALLNDTSSPRKQAEVHGGPSLRSRWPQLLWVPLTGQLAMLSHGPRPVSMVTPRQLQDAALSPGKDPLSKQLPAFKRK